MGKICDVAMPDFLVIGAPKAGSTALHAALAQHPQLFLSDAEGTEVLPDRRPAARTACTTAGPGDAHSAREWVWRREDYERLFAGAPARHPARREHAVLPLGPDAHARIAAAIPDAKLIAVIRDPVDRAYSNWTHLRSDGLEPEADFRARLRPRARARRTAAGRRSGATSSSAATASSSQHLFESLRRASRCTCCATAQLIDEPVQTLDDIATFLGVETGVVTEIPGSNIESLGRPRHR